jgi:hypothetical protein
MTATFTLKCFSCGTIYRVLKTSPKQRQMDMLFDRPRCINATGEKFGNQHTARLNQGQTCGAPLGVGTVQMGANPDRIRQVSLTALTKITVTDRDELMQLRRDAQKVEELRGELAGLQADYEALKATDAVAELARMRVKYETPCPGLVKVYGEEEGQFDVVRCGGFLGHYGDCAQVL